MTTVFRADLRRVLRKPSFIITMIIQILIFAGAVTIVHFFPGSDPKDTLILGLTLASGTLEFLVGLPVFLAVFSDDFRSHAMQVAIGRGTSRNRLISIRYSEFVIILCETHIFFSLLLIGISLVMGYDVKAVSDIIRDLWEHALASACGGAIAMIFVYAMQKGTLGLVVYILLLLGTVDAILMGLSMAIPYLRDNNIALEDYFISGMMDKADSAPYWWAVLVAAYIILPLIISCAIFKKKELEF